MKDRLKELFSRYRLAIVMCSVLMGGAAGLFAEASARGPSVRPLTLGGFQVCEPEPDANTVADALHRLHRFRAVLLHRVEL